MTKEQLFTKIRYAKNIKFNHNTLTFTVDDTQVTQELLEDLNILHALPEDIYLKLYRAKEAEFMNYYSAVAQLEHLKPQQSCIHFKYQGKTGVCSTCKTEQSSISTPTNPPNSTCMHNAFNGQSGTCNWCRGSFDVNKIYTPPPSSNTGLYSYAIHYINSLTPHQTKNTPTQPPPEPITTPQQSPTREILIDE